MSLVTSASIWTNENQPKKRVSTMRKTIKVKPNVEPDSHLGEYTSQYENYQNQQPTIDENVSRMHERNTRVNNLLNKITSVEPNNEDNLGEFNPMPNPDITIKKDISDNNNIIRSQYETPSFYNAMNSYKTASSQFNPNDSLNNEKNIYGNYQVAYDQTHNTHFRHLPADKPNRDDDRLMAKINYMIQLLEEQQYEKTSNISEEFILYTFLGVFIIFIVDSFARSGKYTR